MGDSRRFVVFANFIKNNFPFVKNILDVAGGQYGYLNIELTKLGYNVVTVDPRIKNPNVKHIRCLFDDSFDVSQFDLLVGLHPDEATEYIFRCAKKYNKPYAVVPCCFLPISPQLKKMKFSRQRWLLYLKAFYNIPFECTLPISGANVVLFDNRKRRL